jgi:adenylate cyclase
MQARCPHCGEVNEFTRPPATAIVYCQYCRKPFGAAAFGHVQAQQVPNPKLARRVPSHPGVRPYSGAAPAAAAGARGGPPSAVVTPRNTPVESTRPPQAALGNLQMNGAVVPQVLPSQTGVNATRKSKLIYQSIEGVEAEFVLDDVNTIGRHPKNSIRLHDREVSKNHAVIERRGEDYVLRDLNSSNGTFVNSRRISESVLKEKDELLFGSMQLVFFSGLNDAKSATNSAKDLVTILPQDNSSSTHIHTALKPGDEEADFVPESEISDIETLRRDYEKLRVSYELSRTGISQDFSVFLQRSLDMAFTLLPADNGVILLVEPETGVLVPHTVKRKEGADPSEEIVLSTSIINQVINDRASILLSDAILDPRFSAAQSIISQGIRSAMCVPLLANDVVYGVMHLDSRQRIGAFVEKDLQLLKSLASQAAVAIANTRLLRKVEEDAKTRNQLSRFLAPHIVEQMVTDKGQAIVKSGREVSASVLFCDIRGFTAMTEVAGGPQDIVDLLNDYFERLVEIVFEYHGVVDKYIGDALMAHWGTLPNDKDPTLNSVAAAIGFRDTIREYNRERVEEGLLPIGMGVGVNSGPLVAGYMGAKRRLEYTVIGDTVNTASRLCGLAEPDQVVISAATLDEIRDHVEVEYLGTKKVKGKEQGVEAYQVLSIKPGSGSAVGN